MKDVTSTPAVSDEFRASLKRCLEKAALINYGNLTAEVRLDGWFRKFLLWQKASMSQGRRQWRREM